ncbi:CpaF/VirB11 family protein [Hoeflea sp. WL0058]|uniref:CpaF/VirB11 family protein n=1 Tax=Flavimaribacter sediminis TaxID=2865987 RepID=A0AAE2ZTK7_9HYPH|nr:CpaF/VirB11 family protein [Flavimaribacter sediminis]MBW8640330.1 CpaF/VirB11 family protein [Flavimaribacter sediminis]
MTISLETLSDFKRSNGITLYGNCGAHGCSHGRALPIDGLIERFGPDYVIIGETRIASALRCERCGHRGGVITISASGYSGRK